MQLAPRLTGAGRPASRSLLSPALSDGRRGIANNALASFLSIK